MSLNVALLTWAQAVAAGNEVIVVQVKRDSKGRFVRR